MFEKLTRIAIILCLGAIIASCGEGYEKLRSDIEDCKKAYDKAIYTKNNLEMELKELEKLNSEYGMQIKKLTKANDQIKLEKQAAYFEIEKLNEKLKWEKELLSKESVSNNVERLIMEE